MDCLCARTSLGEEDVMEAKHNRNLTKQPSRFQSCPARATSPAGSESCVAVERNGYPWLRSVDSERAGRATEPRKQPRRWAPTA